VVLRRVREAVEQQVDAEQQEAPRGAALERVRLGRVLLGRRRVQREHGDAGRHGEHDEVLVPGVAASEERDVQEHDGQQLARFREDERDVVDVREAGVAERRGERGRQRHGDERERDGARGEDGRWGGAARRREVEVGEPGEDGEEGLDCVEEDGEFEDLGRGRRAVGRCGEAFLEVGPRQTIVNISISHFKVSTWGLEGRTMKRKCQRRR